MLILFNLSRSLDPSTAFRILMEKESTMEKLEIVTPELQKALPVLRDAIERHKRLLAQSIARTHERVE